MKKILSIVCGLGLMAVLMPACQNDNAPGSGKLATEEAVGNKDASAQTPGAASPTNEPPQNAAGVWHFICPKGCAGGAGAAVPCGQCGETLVHNQIYHGAEQPMNSNPAQGANPAAKPKDEPPQNAKGVWHYTCPKGCSGGSGTASPCPRCATVMTHNPVYHQ